MKHPLYDLCYSAHRNTSFSPDRRAEQEIAAYIENAETVEKHGDPVKHESLFRAWMAAKSRCASSMITGPANFNVRRNEKAFAGEEKHGKAYYAFLDRVQRPARTLRTPNSATAEKTLEALGDTVSESNRYAISAEWQRVYFEFDGKPEDDVRDLLKRNGFKWTPSKGHWERLLTPNALAAAKRVAAQLAADQEAPSRADEEQAR
ncbi:hypothetical protein [Methylobacterium sp. Gmos1]